MLRPLHLPQHCSNPYNARGKPSGPARVLGLSASTAHRAVLGGADRRPAAPLGVCAACMLLGPGLGSEALLRRPTRCVLRATPRLLCLYHTCHVPVQHSWPGQWLGPLSRSRALERASVLRRFPSVPLLQLQQSPAQTARRRATALRLGSRGVPSRCKPARCFAAFLGTPRCQSWCCGYLPRLLGRHQSHLSRRRCSMPSLCGRPHPRGVAAAGDGGDAGLRLFWRRVRACCCFRLLWSHVRAC